MFKDKEYAIIFKSAIQLCYQKILKIRRRFKCINYEDICIDTMNDIITNHSLT